jgi:putative transposase
MPWSQTMPRDQRLQFIADYLRKTLSMTELCDLYHVSRKTGYKWVQRYLRRGPIGLEELSRKPRVSPNQTPAERVAAILQARHHHPSWGAKKLLKILRKKHPRWLWPHRGTVCEILSRHGLVPHKRRRRVIGHPGKPTTQILAPNDVWSADFKGQFKTTNGTYCYPLTVTDGYSRFLLGCQALRSTSVAEAKPVFLRLFQEFGLPQRIRTRGPLCHQYSGKVVPAVGLVGAAGCLTRVHRTGQTPAERPTRAHASHLESRDDASCGCQPGGAAAQVQRLPPRV